MIDACSSGAPLVPASTELAPFQEPSVSPVTLLHLILRRGVHKGSLTVTCPAPVSVAHSYRNPAQRIRFGLPIAPFLAPSLAQHGGVR